ncbi:MAG: amino acid decarboxylase, partial [Clostridia bacterium]|nr:amino acid decarboxylase [Clostridia bacterium]
MMNTPICDFVEHYASKNAVRAHMPGHKGNSFLGCEALDITEINGADSLFESEGVIAESEKNASGIFGCNSFYSAEGASLCIRAMLYLAKLWGKNDLKIIAARNCHKSFISGIALLDIDIDWLTPAGSYLSNG